MRSYTAAPPTIEPAVEATQDFSDWLVDIFNSDTDSFIVSRQLARRLGAYYRPDGLTEVAIWLPVTELEQPARSHRSVYLTALTPLSPVDFQSPTQTVACECHRLPLQQHQDVFYGVFSGLTAGTREQAGTFYCFQYLDSQGALQTVGDILAYSLPYGVFAPAELYDVDRLQRQRTDLSYFAPETASGAVQTVKPPRNILQLHVGTASATETLAGLTRVYQRIADKLRDRIQLTTAEENYIGYDAVQLLPLEPVAEYQDPAAARPGFARWDSSWSDASSSANSHTVQLHLSKPDTQNWGYDTVLHGSVATNPALLSSLRPEELIDFIATLHNFPTGPIQVIYDLVYGHTDNQATNLLHRYFLQGPNMYGQDINHRHPTVRAILLEMQRRKVNTGADGVRIDGAQDFRFFNPETGQIEYDDDYLEEMGNVLQTIGGHQRRLFAIYEDGRPWPAKGWEEKATYRDVIERQPDAYQWGPLIFAHNTPTLKQFWQSKWNRICEVMKHGSHWISGCANHDTMRRGTQINPHSNINWHLGDTLTEVIRSAYDNPAVALLFYGFSPGIPMDFLNATMHTPWGFFRNTDSHYGIKITADEVGFLDWQVSSQLFDQPWAFTRMKQLGVNSLEQLRTFVGWLHEAVEEMQPGYDLNYLARMCQQVLNATLENPPRVTVELLQSFSKSYMQDCHNLCNVTHYANNIDSHVAQFNLRLRHYRHMNPWLRQNLTQSDCFSHFVDSSTVFYGVRSCPLQESSQQIAIICHMGGQPITLNIADLLSVNLAEWQIAVTTPELSVTHESLDTVELRDGDGLLLEHR